MAIFAIIFDFLFSLEVWMIFVLAMSFYQQDGAARRLNNIILLNIVFVQSMKRFVFRKRPSSVQPPRSLFINQNTSSSFPSKTVVSATTLTFAVSSLNNWTGFFSGLNSSGIGVAFVAAISVYILSSFFKVNMGSCYPTDCIVSLIPIVVILLLHWIIHLCVSAI